MTTSQVLFWDTVYYTMRQVLSQELQNGFTAGDEIQHVGYTAWPQQTRIGFVWSRSELYVESYRRENMQLSWLWS